MRKPLKKLLRTDRVSWTAILTPKKKNTMRSARNLRVFVTLSSKPVLTKAKSKRRSSATKDSDFV